MKQGMAETTQKPGGNKYSAPLLWALFLLLFLLVGIVWSRPVHQHLFSGIPYEVSPREDLRLIQLSPQDNLQLYYRYWLAGESARGNIPPFSNPYEFATPGTRGFTSQQVPVSLLFFLFSAWDPILAYNLIILLSFVACGAGMMLWCHHYTRDYGAALVAGLIFAIMPFRLPQLYAGHPNGVAICLLPFFFFFAEKALLHNRFRYGVIAGLFFTSIALTDMQLAFFASVLVAGFLLYRLICLVVADAAGAPRRAARWLGGLATGVLPAAVYLSYVKFFMLPASAIHGSEEGHTHRIGPLFRDFLDPHIMGERRIYIGPWVLLLGLAAIILLPIFSRHRRKFVLTSGVHLSRRRRPFIAWSFPLFWLGAMAVGLILSLSLEPVFSRWVWRLPILSTSRTPVRAMTIAFPAAAMLAALGVSALRRLCGTRTFFAACITLVCVTLIGHDYWLSGPRGINLLPRHTPAFETMREESAEPRGLAIPIWPGDSHMSAHLLYHITRSRVPLLNGYSPVATAEYRQRVFEPLSPINVGDFGETEWRVAREFEVTHVTFHPEAFPSPRWVSVYPAGLTLARLRESPYLEEVAYFDPITLFRLRSQPRTDDLPESPASSPVGITVPGRFSDVPDSEVVPDDRSLMGRVLRIPPATGPDPILFRHRGRVMPPGIYRISAWIAADPGDALPADGPWCALQVLDAVDGTVLQQAVFEATGEPRAGFVRIEAEFGLDHATRLAFELENRTPHPLRIDFLHLEFADTVDHFVWQAEELFHAGRVTELEDGAGRAVLLDDRDPTEQVIHGPYRLLPPGAYRLIVHGSGKGLHRGDTAGSIRLHSRISPIAPPMAELGEMEIVPKVAYGQGMEQWDYAFDVPEPGVLLEVSFFRRREAILLIDRIAVEPRETGSGYD